MLTGRNHHAVGMGYLADFDTGFANSRGAISPKAATIADMLGTAGYGAYVAMAVLPRTLAAVRDAS